MEIEEFLMQRLSSAEDLLYTLPDISDLERQILIAPIKAARQVVEWHKNWPVLVETPPKFEANFANDYDPMTSYTISASQKIAWLTQEEYVKRFGRQPPTAPLLRTMANHYSAHRDFNPDWKN